MINRDDIIEVGSYNKPHGINGEISATFNYDLDVIAEQECFISEINGIFVPFFADGKRQKGNSTLLLKINGFDNEDSVKLLVNKKIYVRKDRFSSLADLLVEDEDELPLDYFIGFTLLNEDDDDSEVGTIIDVDTATENYLFIVETENGEVMIPANEDFIMDIDIEDKTITMSLPEGLFDI